MKEIFKPRLLRETAEIALTEIKRFIEPRLAEEFSLRRVSAPLYLPADSGLNDPGEAVRFRLPGTGQEVEIVNGLIRWLRSQLVRYDIAPGFGVFTVMNALRPDEIENATTSPHISAWAWQQVTDPEKATDEYLVGAGKRLYRLLCETEDMIISILPHLDKTLPSRLVILDTATLAEEHPDQSQQRREYEYLREHPSRALLMIEEMNSRLLVWNKVVGRPLTLADTRIDLSAPIGSIGGNLLRDQLAMQILHQPHLLR